MKKKVELTGKIKKWLKNNNMNYRIYDTINTYGIKETRSLLMNFLSGEAESLGDDEGFIISMFIGYYNQSELEDEEAIVSMFIGYTQYKWERTRDSLYWLEKEDDDKGEGSGPRTRFKKFSDVIKKD